MGYVIKPLKADKISEEEKERFLKIKKGEEPETYGTVTAEEDSDFEFTKVEDDYSIVIPGEIVRQCGWTPGQRLVLMSWKTGEGGVIEISVMIDSEWKRLTDNDMTLVNAMELE